MAQVPATEKNPVASNQRPKSCSPIYLCNCLSLLIASELFFKVRYALTPRYHHLLVFHLNDDMYLGLLYIFVSIVIYCRSDIWFYLDVLQRHGLATYRFKVIKHISNQFIMWKMSYCVSWELLFYSYKRLNKTVWHNWWV